MTNLAKELGSFVSWSSEYLLQNFKEKGFKVKSKSSKDFVTECDEKVEEKFLELVDSLWPDASIIAEEKISRKRQGELTFVIDPIDGTNNFAFGVPVWGTSIAVFRNGKPFYSIVGLHPEGAVLTAESGKGAFCNGKKLSVSRRSMAESMVLLDSRLEKLEQYRFRDSLFALGKQVSKTRMLGAAVYNICYVAMGKAEAGIEFDLKPVDYPASCHILEEAGGTVLPFWGCGSWTELNQCGLIVACSRELALDLKKLMI